MGRNQAEDVTPSLFTLIPTALRRFPQVLGIKDLQFLFVRGSISCFGNRRGRVCSTAIEVTSLRCICMMERGNKMLNKISNKKHTYTYTQTHTLAHRGTRPFNASEKENRVSSSPFSPLFQGDLYLLGEKPETLKPGDT